MTTTNNNTETNENTLTTKAKTKSVYLKGIKNKVKKQMTKRINSYEDNVKPAISSGFSKHVLHKRKRIDSNSNTTNTTNEGNTNSGHDMTTNDDDGSSRDDNDSHDDDTTPKSANTMPSSPTHKKQQQYQERKSFFGHDLKDQYDNLSRRMEFTNMRQTKNTTSSTVILSPSTTTTPKVSFNSNMTNETNPPPPLTTTTPSSDTLSTLRSDITLLLLSDVSIIIISLSQLCYVTYLHRDDILKGCLPCVISAIWTIYGFFMGCYMSPLKGLMKRRKIMKRDDDMIKVQPRVEEVTKQFRSSLTTFNKMTETQHSDDDNDDTRQSQPHDPTQDKNNHDDDDDDDDRHHHFIIHSISPFYFKNFLKSRKRKRKRPSTPSSSQQQQQQQHHRRVHLPKQHKWEESLCDPVDDTLMDRLLSLSSSQQQQQQVLIGGDTNDDDDDGSSSPPSRTPKTAISPLGHQRLLSQSKVDTLINEVVEPMCRLRGMDIFKSDDPVENICTNRELLRCGLRDVPTFIINVMTPSYNLVCYFQLPSWFSNFHDVMEHPNDTNHVKMFKRFLNGTNEYRRNTFKILPCVPVAPLALRLLSPSKQEYAIHGPTLPITIRQYEECEWRESSSAMEEEGRGEENGGMTNEMRGGSSSSSAAALLSFDIDCMTHPAIRKLSTLVLRHLNKCVLDLAFVIHDDDNDLACCVGLMRLDHVDVNDGVVLSGPTEREDVMMATEWKKRSVVGEEGGE